MRSSSARATLTAWRRRRCVRSAFHSKSSVDADHLFDFLRGIVDKAAADGVARPAKQRRQTGKRPTATAVPPAALAAGIGATSSSEAGGGQRPMLAPAAPSARDPEDDDYDE